MRTSFHVIVNQRGATRLTKGLPAMTAGEVAVKVNLTVPDGVFRSPFVEAGIEVPEGYIIRPSAEVWLEPVEEPAEPDTQMAET